MRERICREVLLPLCSQKDLDKPLSNVLQCNMWITGQKPAIFIVIKEKIMLSKTIVQKSIDRLPQEFSIDELIEP